MTRRRISPSAVEMRGEIESSSTEVCVETPASARHFAEPCTSDLTKVPHNALHLRLCIPRAMAHPFPYTYYSCDCYDSKVTTISAKRTSQPPPAEDEDERTFDPRSPRSNYSLYPLEHLLYCEDCQQIRCPRCVIEETLNWFCPSCLFEVPSSVVKSDGNRYGELPCLNSIEHFKARTWIGC